MDDIRKYYDIDIKGYAIAAPTAEIDETTYTEYKNKLNLNRDHHYFQAGNFVLDCELWRKEKIFEKLQDIIINHNNDSEYPDMDALNIYFENNYKKLPFRYSVCTHMIKNKKNITSKVNEEIKNAVLIHYSSRKKPWKTKKIPFSKEFWSIAKQTNFYSCIKKLYYKNKYKTDE